MSSSLTLPLCLAVTLVLLCSFPFSHAHCDDCQDLTTDCRYSTCSNDHQRVWCARTCNSCYLRKKCYNADGDTVCKKLAAQGLCASEPFTKVICKKECTNCDPPTPPTCEDLTTDCADKGCDTDHKKVWCAGTCKTCSLRDKCYNADGDDKCFKIAAQGLCASDPFTKVICKKECTHCDHVNPPPCKDLTTDCAGKGCDTDHKKVWCAGTCKTCAYRDKCYNADGDETCFRLAAIGLCASDPFTKYICKKECTRCNPPPPKCRDLTTDCAGKGCNTDHKKVWCAETCKTCAYRDRCYNADGDKQCMELAAKGLCASEPFALYVCKKACGVC